MSELKNKLIQELYDFNVHADITVEDLTDVMLGIMKGISGREYVKEFGVCPICTDCPKECPLDR